MPFTRRSFLATAGAATSVATLHGPAIAQGVPARVVVIGGGFGGATAAKYLRRGDPRLDVTLVERENSHIACPLSNAVIGGFRALEDNRLSFDRLQQMHGVKLVRDEATAIDVAGKTVSLAGGSKLAYDKVILSPGVGFSYEAVPGYSESAIERMPHAWVAGPQTALLRRQIEAMPDGGTVIICPPPNPYRCPSGPYERASLIAWYLKNKKPRSKILIFDAKDEFAEQTLFEAAWESEFPGMITWVAGKDGGKVEQVDPAALTVTTGFGTEKGDVVNVIPPQTAGAVAMSAGLASPAWCAIDPTSFASRQAPDIFVIGDSAQAGTMPKSATSANLQAKAAVAAVLAQLAGRQPEVPALFSVCYSLLTPDQAISVTNVFGISAEQGIYRVPNSGGVSVRTPTSLDERRREAAYTADWYRNITADGWT